MLTTLAISSNYFKTYSNGAFNMAALCESLITYNYIDNRYTTGCIQCYATIYNCKKMQTILNRIKFFLCFFSSLKAISIVCSILLIDC